MNAIASLDLRRRASAFRWRMTSRLDHIRRAWRYLCGTMTGDDAYRIMRDCYDTAGSYPLETLDVSSLIDYATDQWQDHPALPDLCQQAAERVYGKWTSDGHLSGAAEEWAMSLIPDYAKAAGVTLVARDCPEA